MGFWGQLLGAAAVFAAIEGAEGAARALRPGLPVLAYWAVKLAVGLPLAGALALAILAGGQGLDVAALLAGGSLAGAAILWAFGAEADE